MRNVFHRADRMLVHRIMVIHVELGLRDNAAKFRQEPAEHAGLIHPIQGQAQILAFEQDVEKDRNHFGIGAILGVNEFFIPCGDGEGIRMDIDALLVCYLEQAQQSNRIVLNRLRISEIDAISRQRKVRILERLGR